MKSVRRSSNALLCHTCPRVLHFDCLRSKAAHSGHLAHCPLCIKRRWHLIQPVTPRQREGQFAEDFYMKRVRRYQRWHRYHCMHIQEWNRWADDGSLENDRELMFKIGAAKGAVGGKADSKKASSWERDQARDRQDVPLASGALPVESRHEGIPPHLPDDAVSAHDFIEPQQEVVASELQPSQQALSQRPHAGRPPSETAPVELAPQGTAAECFDPNATGLESRDLSRRASSKRPSQTSKRSGQSKEPPVAVSPVASQDSKDKRYPPSASHLASTLGTSTDTSYASGQRSVSRGRSRSSFRRGQADPELDSIDTSEVAQEAQPDQAESRKPEQTEPTEPEALSPKQSHSTSS